MFFRRKLKVNKEMIANMRPTSKATLKQMCLLAANGDLEKAQNIYDYMIKDMEDMPLFDTPQPSVMQQVKQGIGETMQWLGQNQEEIFVWADLLKGMFSKNGNSGASSVPNVPIPTQQKVNPIPNIN